MRDITLYYFDELSKAAQDKAVKNTQLDNDFILDDYADDILQEHTAQLENLGFSDVKIYYTGFCCQGDGACFTASNIDIVEFFNNQTNLLKIPHRDFIIKVLANNYSFKVVKISHHYEHKYTVNIDIDENNWSHGGGYHVNNIVLKIIDILNDFKNEYCDIIYDEIESEYNLYYEPESIKNYLIDMEIEFFQDGTRYKNYNFQGGFSSVNV